MPSTKDTSPLPEHPSRKQITGGCRCVLVENYCVFTADSDIFSFMFLIYTQIYSYPVCVFLWFCHWPKYTTVNTQMFLRKKKRQSVFKRKPTTPDKIILIFTHIAAIKLVQVKTYQSCCWNSPLQRDLMRVSVGEND